MQFDDLLGGNAGGLMEPVDVLGDHRTGRTAAGIPPGSRHAGTVCGLAGAPTAKTAAVSCAG